MTANVLPVPSNTTAAVSTINKGLFIATSLLRAPSNLPRMLANVAQMNTR
jgi:hypothetical protein